MLDSIIRFSLNNRIIILAFSVLLLIGGFITLQGLPVDVLPDLNRPRVTVFLEAEGMAPEEIETQVVFPVETALNGASGVEAVRSNSTSGLGMVFIEFNYGTDIMLARQVVTEKLQAVQGQLPRGIMPVLGPISSVMGQIMLVGLSADTTSAATLRTLADYTLRPRLLSVTGVAQVIPIGGEIRQYQVLLSLSKLNSLQLTIADVEQALQRSNLNTTGNFFDRNGSEVLIRNLGRLHSLEELRNVVVANRAGGSVLLSQVAEVQFGARYKRGDGSLNGKQAVILSIEKQPGASTTTLTHNLNESLKELKTSLPKDVKLHTEVFRQADFIESAIGNVEEALRDGAILVVIVLFIFLLNFKTTFISLTAIPLSLIITALIFKALDISINTMTLGGLAIAIGELVDDAIVDVENVFRRLRENKHSPQPKPALQVVYEASKEVRNSIVYATIIVVLVFVPLFFLGGMEGRIFAPLGIAYITSIIASLLVSLTVTPVLCYYLLPNSKSLDNEKEGLVVRWLKKQDTKLLNFGLNHPKLVLTFTAALLIGAMSLVPFFGSEFLPPFNEGSLTINFSTPAGTSLQESNKLGALAEKQILQVPEVTVTARRTGRAELDEHAEPVSNSEIEVGLKVEEGGREKDVVIEDIRQRLSIIKGANVNIGQPISHRLDHLLSGVRAQVAIKLFGSDLTGLRQYAAQIQSAVATVPGVVDLQIEKQVQVPQLLVKIRPEALKNFGMVRGDVVEELQTLFQGQVVSQILDEAKTYDLVVKLPEQERNNVASIQQALVATPAGQLVPVSQLADIYFENGPNTINHENTQRRIVISCNVSGRDLGSTVKEMRAAINKQVKLPTGYYLAYGGQFESQQSASQLILLLSVVSLFGIFLVLFAHFGAWQIVLQIMLNIPLALIGSVVAVMLTGGVFSIASLVGFITLTGIASRNGIMMISHYLHLIEHEGETFNRQLIMRGSLERLVPVLMTALVAALALIPLTLSKDAPGKEILYPVATVILGGLLSSTLLDIIVTPVVFSLFGEKALRNYFNKKNQIDLNAVQAAPLTSSIT